MTKDRIQYLDCIAGLFIIEIILAHCAQFAKLTNNPIYIFTVDNILFFYMPWFFFKSGMFFERQESRELKTRRLINDFKRLIVPYIKFSIIGELLFLIFIFNTDSWIDYFVAPIKDFVYIGSLTGNLPLWFLLSLFVVRQLFSVLRINIYIGIAISFLLAFLASSIGITHPYIVANVALGYFFFSLGFLCNKLKINKSVYYFALAAFIVIQLIIPSNVDMRANDLYRGNYIIWAISCALGILLINLFFKLAYKPENIIVRVMEAIGKNSMFYYTVHWIIILAVNVIFDKGNGISHHGYFSLLVVTNISFFAIYAYFAILKRNKFISNK